MPAFSLTTGVRQAVSAEEQLAMEQNKRLWEYKDALERECTTAELKEVLRCGPLPFLAAL
jgi:hypothetical protein